MSNLKPNELILIRVLLNTSGAKRGQVRKAIVGLSMKVIYVLNPKTITAKGKDLDFILGSNEYKVLRRLS